MNVTEKAQQDLKGLTKDQLKALLKYIYANVPLIGPEEDDPLGEALTKAYEETAKEMLAQMYDKTENPAEIYLVPVGLDEYVWCDTPSPGEGMREEDATRYVREDIYLALRAKVEQLRDKLQLAHTFITCTDETGYIDGAGFVDAELLAAELHLAISETQAQCLAEIQADAYWKGYVAGGDDFRSRINIPLEVVTKKANELIIKLYPESESAKKIRQAAKGGAA